MKKTYTVLLLGIFLMNSGFVHAQQDRYDWPEVKKESKTWTRWWWMGSAVDKKNISRSLIAFKKAGIGGVEIEPIYGVKGQEENFIDYIQRFLLNLLIFRFKKSFKNLLRFISLLLFVTSLYKILYKFWRV